MTPSKLSKVFTVLSICVLFTGCIETPWDSMELNNYEAKNGSQKNLGQVRFIYDSLNSLSLAGLMNTNIIPLKVYGTALLLADEETSQRKLNGNDLPKVMQKYGFIRAEKIANWRKDLAVEPELDGTKINGFVRQKMHLNVLGKKLNLEVANFTCAACHGGVTYDSQGLPTRNVWLGAPNTSLNFDGFLGKIYQGLRIGLNDETRFLNKMKEAYPQMDDSEYNTIANDLMPIVRKEIDKIAASTNRVLPFYNGGPGITNGVGAFKRDADLLKNKYQFHTEESGFVSIPDISYRGFRSSLTYDGAYGVIGEERFRTIEQREAYDFTHGMKLAELASFFTFSAMGNTMTNAERAIPRVKEIFSVLQFNRPPAYPKVIDEEKALRGSHIYADSCAKCHGTYTEGVHGPQLVSFPNKLVSTENIGTDPLRWQNIDKSIVNYTHHTRIGQHVDAGHSMGGYVAPILSGLWYTAPYLHNGSVPTLWQLMNPELRPQRFEFGGHALDMEDVGIRGQLNDKGEYIYPSNYTAWSIPAMYDTTQPGRSNKGHEKEFANLSKEQKRDLLEYLKLL